VLPTFQGNRLRVLLCIWRQYVPPKHWHSYQTVWSHQTDLYSCSSLGSHSDGVWIESQLRHWLSWLRVFCGSSQSLLSNAGIVPLLGHDCFLPNPFPFMIYGTSRQSVLCTHSLATDSVRNCMNTFKLILMFCVRALVHTFLRVFFSFFAFLSRVLPRSVCPPAFTTWNSTLLTLSPCKRKYTLLIEHVTVLACVLNIWLYRLWWLHIAAPPLCI
jgi:hypothetical protein